MCRFSLCVWLRLVEQEANQTSGGSYDTRRGKHDKHRHQRGPKANVVRGAGGGDLVRPDADALHECHAGRQADCEGQRLRAGQAEANDGRAREGGARQLRGGPDGVVLGGDVEAEAGELVQPQVLFVRLDGVRGPALSEQKLCNVRLELDLRHGVLVAVQRECDVAVQRRRRHTREEPGHSGQTQVLGGHGHTEDDEEGRERRVEHGQPRQRRRVQAPGRHGGRRDGVAHVGAEVGHRDGYTCAGHGAVPRLLVCDAVLLLRQAAGAGAWCGRGVVDGAEASEDGAVGLRHGAVALPGVVLRLRG
eukprot:Rhum_TRINITY_DN15290_c0_g1::Rhum_TRINITY_DN15290_c0_g1_i1::g.149528::m.149528